MIIEMSSLVDATIALLGAVGILVIGISTLSFSDAIAPPEEAASAEGRAALGESPALSKAA